MALGHRVKAMWVGHGIFLNSTGRHYCFLKLTRDMGTPGQGPPYGWDSGGLRGVANGYCKPPVYFKVLL